MTDLLNLCETQLVPNHVSNSLKYTLLIKKKIWLYFNTYTCLSENFSTDISNKIANLDYYFFLFEEMKLFHNQLPACLRQTQTDRQKCCLSQESACL